MTDDQSSTLPTTSSAAAPAVLQAQQDIETINRELIGLSTRSIRPSDGPNDRTCSRFIAVVQNQMGVKTDWRTAVFLATRLAVLPTSGRDSDDDKKLVIQLLAEALAEYPLEIARYAVASLLRSCEWRPAPAAVHKMAGDRRSQLVQAVRIAEKILETRTTYRAERDREQRQRIEDERARAEGRETSAQQRARIVADARSRFRPYVSPDMIAAQSASLDSDGGVNGQFASC